LAEPAIQVPGDQRGVRGRHDQVGFLPAPVRAKDAGDDHENISALSWQASPCTRRSLDHAGRNLLMDLFHRTASVKFLIRRPYVYAWFIGQPGMRALN
jgi:hypothetical protein